MIKFKENAYFFQESAKVIALEVMPDRLINPLSTLKQCQNFSAIRN